MIRPQAVVLPLLRAALPGVSVVSSAPGPNDRQFPLVVISREGGTRHPGLPRRFALPVLELEAVSADGPVQAEELYDEALDALYDAVSQQLTIAGVGYLHSVNEAQGPTETPSEFPDTWAVTGSVRLAVKASPR